LLSCQSINLSGGFGNFGDTSLRRN
jgi:hypothetical protein